MVHGRYTVVRKLAEGGMAEIFLARQHGSEGFERLVVLKRIHSGFVADEQFRNMLIDEAHISMGLHHNNIVQVLDLGRAGGRLFLVLELVDGWDMSWLLERALAAKRPLPTGLGLYVIVEVCRALAYAHGRSGPKGEAMGIVHRDISPQNVLLSEQGEVKLADFGIAKAMTKRDRTATGVVKGKIAFMSPEQALGQGIDARSDLFSLGTMLYLVSVGVRPFEANTDFEVLARVQKGQFTPPEDVRPELAPSLTAVIRRLMAVDREHRYQTADELLVDLEGIWRSEFGAPGETELKLWLGELGRSDGVPPIGKISFATNTRSSGTPPRRLRRSGGGPSAGAGGRREERPRVHAPPGHAGGHRGTRDRRGGAGGERAHGRRPGEQDARGPRAAHDRQRTHHHERPRAVGQRREHGGDDAPDGRAQPPAHGGHGLRGAGAAGRGGRGGHVEDGHAQPRARGRPACQRRRAPGGGHAAHGEPGAARAHAPGRPAAQTVPDHRPPVDDARAAAQSDRPDHAAAGGRPAARGRSGSR